MAALRTLRRSRAFSSAMPDASVTVGRASVSMMSKDQTAVSFDTGSVNILNSTPFYGQTPSRLFEGAEPIKVVETENGVRKMGLICPNVDLRKNQEWSAADVAEMKKQLHNHKGVLTFPNQSEELSPHDHVGFASHFGQTEIHTTVKGIPGYPDVMEIQREPTSVVIFGEDYHSDHSFQTHPASYSFLRATNEVTPYGTNNTEFSNTIDAYADLSPLMKKLVRDLWVSHSSTKAYGESNQGAKGGHKGNSLYAMKETKGMVLTNNPPIPDEHHPVVMVHPESGEPALFISETFTNGIVGMTHEEGMQLILLLQRHCTQDKYIFEVAYEANQVTMWDNRQLIHRGLVNDTSCRRVIQRVSVSSGAIPISLNEWEAANQQFDVALSIAEERKRTDAMATGEWQQALAGPNHW